MKIEEVLSRFQNGEKTIALSGEEGWSVALQLRIAMRPATVKQIINQDLIPHFHQSIDGYVQKIIAQRVVLGIQLKNLITFGAVKEIEKSNKETLKETRMLPDGIEYGSMIAVFGGIVTITSIEEVSSSTTVLINDAIVAKSIESLFDCLWQQSLPV